MEFGTKRLYRMGEITETPSGKVLVNDDGVAYSANETTIAVWDSFEGNTVEEVTEELATAIVRRPEELIEEVGRIASELEKADLLVG